MNTTYNEKVTDWKFNNDSIILARQIPEFKNMGEFADIQIRKHQNQENCRSAESEDSFEEKIESPNYTPEDELEQGPIKELWQDPPVSKKKSIFKRHKSRIKYIKGSSSKRASQLRKSKR